MHGLGKYNNKQLKEVLKKYLDGTATNAEKKSIDAWYEAFEPDNADQNTEVNKERIYRLLHEGIDQHLQVDQEQKRNNVKTLWYRISAAATVLIFLSAGILYFKNHKANTAEDQVVSTLNGEHKTINLPDGSVVSLNGRSRLVISNDFNEHDRRIKLEGEAFFDVAKNPQKPFIITSGVLQTVVKGTSFDIRAYRDLGHIKISVATGIVKVLKQNSDAGHEVLTDGITQNQTLTYSLKTGKGEIKSELTSEISSWLNNKVFIDNYTIPEIAALLERHFSQKVHIEPGVNLDAHFTMDITNPSLPHALSTLSILTKHKFLSNNNQSLLKDK